MKKWIVALAGMAIGIVQAATPVQRWTLENGATVVFMESRALPMLDIQVSVDGGSVRDPAQRAGLASMTSTMLTRGVEKSGNQPALTEDQVLDGFADIGARFGAGASMDFAGASLRVLSSQRERAAAVSLMARVLAHPAFPQAPLERDKSRFIADLAEAGHQPDGIADKAFWPALYGTHPYGQQPDAKSVAAITRDEVLAFYRQHYTARSAVVAMIGDVSRDEAHRIAQELTRGLPQGKPLAPVQPVTLPAAAEKRIAHPASQSHIMIGMPSAAQGDPDEMALRVGNYILGGGGFVSRLMSEVREKRGLVYGVYSYFSFMRQPGPFMVGLQTRQSQTDEALKLTRSVLHDFLAKGPTDAELQAAKDNLTGGFALKVDSNSELLGFLVTIGRYNLPLDYIDSWTGKVAAVTTEQVRAAFARKVQEQHLVTIVVGKGSK